MRTRVVLLTAVSAAFWTHFVHGQSETTPTAGTAIQTWKLPVADSMRLPSGSTLGLQDRDGSIWQDPDGNIWVTTGSHGVARITKNLDVVRIYSTVDGLASNVVDSLFMDSQHRVWIGSLANSVTFFASQADEPNSLSTADGGTVAGSIIFEDRRKRVWFGGWSASNAYSLGAEGLLAPVTDTESLRAIIELPWQPHDILLVEHNRLSRFELETADRRILDELLPVPLITLLEQRQSKSRADALSYVVRESMAIDAAVTASGELWIAFEDGIASCSDGFQNAMLDETWIWPDYGQPQWLIAARDASLWCSSSKGLYVRVPNGEGWREVRSPSGASLRKSFIDLSFSGNGVRIFSEHGMPLVGIVGRDSSVRVRSALLDDYADPRAMVRVRDGIFDLRDSDVDTWQRAGMISGLLVGNGHFSGCSIDPSGKHRIVAGLFIHRDRSGVLLGHYGLDGRTGRWNPLRPYWSGYGSVTHVGRTGAVWCQVDGRLVGFPRGRLESWMPLDQGRKPIAVYEDKQGTVWISTTGGLFNTSWETRELTLVKSAEGLGHVTTIYDSPIRVKRMWFGGEAGKARLIEGELRIDLPTHPFLSDSNHRRVVEEVVLAGEIGPVTEVGPVSEEWTPAVKEHPSDAATPQGPDDDVPGAPAGEVLPAPDEDVAPAATDDGPLAPGDTTDTPEPASPVSDAILQSDSVVAIAENQHYVWIGLRNSLLAYRRDGISFSADPSRSLQLREANLQALQWDDRGLLWIQQATGSDAYISVFDPNQRSFNTFSRDLLGGSPTMPDAEGGIWIAQDEGVGHLAWNGNGVPGRPELQPFSEHTRWLGRLAVRDDDTWALWRTRFTGILHSTKDTATPFGVETAYPVSVMEPTRDGGVWVGYQMYGLARWGSDGLEASWNTDVGLPHRTVLDISAVPDAEAPTAWVATNDGAALVSDTVERVMVSASPGPVDAIVALPNGKAYAAFNPIASEWFLTADKGLIDARSQTHLRLLSADGSVGESIPLPRGQILDMALDADGKTVWIGSTAGLYTLADERITKITAAGRLGDIPIRVLASAPDGAIWMGVDRQSEDSAASIIGYQPAENDITIMSVDMGLPEGEQVEMVDFLPDGRLAGFVGGRLVRSRDPLFVRPPASWWPLIAGTIIAIALTGAGTAVGIRYQTHKRDAARYAPLVSEAESFFEQIGRSTRRRDYRTLELEDARTYMPEASAGDIAIHCLAGDVVNTEEVKAVAERMREPGTDTFALNYLFAERSFELPVRWQLDTIRLRERKVIIPLTLAYARRALEKGVTNARNALEALDRRYLAEQDLFDMRNALDEPRFFFGREAFLDEIVKALSRREHIAVIGQRKVGKTSVLNMLGQQLDDFPIVMLDMQIYSRQEDWPPLLLKQVLSGYDNWGRARFGEQWTPQSQLGENATGTEFERAICERHELRDKLGSQTPLVVVLDEIERVFPSSHTTGRPEEDAARMAEATRYVQATGILRALGQRQGQRLLCLIVADRDHKFNRVNHFGIPTVDTNPFYALFVEKFVVPLQEDHCVEMLKYLGHAMGIEVSDEAAMAIHRDSGGHPRFARLLASAAYQHRESSEKLGTTEYHRGLEWLRDDDGGADDFIRENIWLHVSAAERTILGRSCADEGVKNETLEAPGPAISAGRDLAADTPNLQSSELKEARQHLVATEMLEKVEKGLRVNGALIRTWIQELTSHDRGAS